MFLIIHVLRALENACLTGGSTPQISWWKLVPGFTQYLNHAQIKDVARCFNFGDMSRNGPNCHITSQWINNIISRMASGRTTGQRGAGTQALGCWNVSHNGLEMYVDVTVIWKRILRR